MRNFWLDITMNLDLSKLPDFVTWEFETWDEDYTEQYLEEGFFELVITKIDEKRLDVEFFLDPKGRTLPDHPDNLIQEFIDDCSHMDLTLIAESGLTLGEWTLDISNIKIVVIKQQFYCLTMEHIVLDSWQNVA